MSRSQTTAPETSQIKTLNGGLSAVNLRPQPAVPVSFWAWLLLCALLVVVVSGIRLAVFPHRVMPLAYGLPLLVCLWHRDLRLLYGMAVLFSGIAMLKVFGFMPEPIEPWYDFTAIGFMLMNIWIVVGVVHGVIYYQRRLERKNTDLELANAELEAGNEELAAREEEISRQNEELQSQAEELERQAEELRQQTEELEHQSAELQTTNEELLRREKGLQTLLNSARWLRSDLAEQDVMAATCQAAVEIMDDKIAAAAIVQEKDGRLWLRGQSGFGANGTMKRDLSFDRSFAALVMEKGQAAYLADLSTRPDVETAQPLVGKPFRSVLAAPVWVEGRVIGAVEIYSQQPREWSEDEFRVVEWLAAQTALSLQAVEYQRGVELKRHEAEEVSLQKTRFLAAVSHDVRTPANAISLLADLVEQMAGDPGSAKEVASLVRDLKANARGLVELVSDVLDLTRFDAGSLDLQIGEFSLASLIESEIRQFRTVAEEKGLGLNATLPPPSIWLRSDKMKLSRVLGNLIGNAIKFTPAGQVHIFCRGYEGGEAQRSAEVNNGAPDGSIELVVSDTGVGIPSKSLPRIFDEFYQLRNPERDRNKGTGLGLAICRRLADGMGCKLTVESMPGRGTAFSVHVPREFVVQAPAGGGSPSSAPEAGKNRAADGDGLRPAHSPEAAAESSAPQSSSGSPPGAVLNGLQVLLVEDHDTTRAALAQILAARGAVVFQAPDCRAALHLLARENPDVLLLDLMLPDQDGTEVLRFLRHRRPQALKCVLVVSADAREARIDEVKQLGANALVPKPLTSESLMAALRRHLPESAFSRAPMSEPFLSRA